MAAFKVIHSQNTDSCYRQDKPKYHDSDALSTVITYCCAPEKTKSGYIGGFGINIHDAAEQMESLARTYYKADGIRLRHMVLSFESWEKITPFMAFQIAYQAAWYYGSSYQILFAVHENTTHPHIHFVMNTVSYLDGHKYAGKREDYYNFQQHLRNVLWPYGIELKIA